MLTLKLKVRGDGAPSAREVTTSAAKISLGRGDHCDVVLGGREFGASAEHARIEKLGGVYYLFDQGSTNGTALNGTRIRSHTSAPLATNDKIYIGRWVIRCRILRETARSWHHGQESDPRAESFVRELKAVGDDPLLLAAAVSAELESLERHERSNILRQVAEALGSGPQHDAVQAEIDRREAMREACYEAMTSLSAHHTGVERFDDPEQVMRFFRLADQSLELLLEWIVGCISSRRTFEERFSAKVTRFFGMEANPIKHALTPAMAGKYLLNHEDERDAEQIKKNLQQALDDLTTHQLAIVGGVQRALRKAFERFDPEEQEKQSGGSWLGGPFSKAKAWDQFRAVYDEFVENEAKLYNEVIYPSLREGYLQATEEQLGEGKPEEDRGPDATCVISD